MEIRIQVVIDNDEGTRRDIAHWDRPALTSETLGMQLGEARALLEASQAVMVGVQVEGYLAKRADCPHCGRIHRLKGRHEIVVRSLFGTLRLRSPRLRHCSCQGSRSPSAGKSFSPFSIPDANPDDPDDCRERLLESAKCYLWHGNVHRSLERIDTLIELTEHDERVPEGPERRKLARTLNELYDDLESNRDLIPDDRRRHGEAISSSIAESTVNQVISRRFVKEQQMRWQPETAHLLLQVRTRTLNGNCAKHLNTGDPQWHRSQPPPCRSLRAVARIDRPEFTDYVASLMQPMAG